MFVLVSLGIFALLSGALTAASHYLAPRIAGRELHRLEAYIAGCLLGIALPFGGWYLFLWLAGHVVPVLAPLGLLVIMAGAGLGTVTSWALDAWAGTRAELQARRRRDGEP